MRRLLVATAVATLMTGCSPGEDGGNRGDRGTTDGPLVSRVGDGGNSLDAPPRRDRWTGTFGGLLVCTKDGADVEIDNVTYHFVVRPVATRALIRKVPAAVERQGAAESWAPMIALRGTVGQLEDEIAATSLEPPPGVIVTTPCDHDGPDDAYTELITSMTTDQRGGWIDEATIAYTRGGQDYELDIPWTYVTCGSAINGKWTDESMPAPC